MATADESHPHYYREFRGGKIDFYRLCDLFGPFHPAQEHASKKIFFAGDRNHKDKIKDIEEAIDSLKRWLEMLEEDNETNTPEAENPNEEIVPITGAVERVLAKARQQAADAIAIGEDMELAKRPPDEKA